MQNFCLFCEFHIKTINIILFHKNEVIELYNTNFFFVVAGSSSKGVFGHSETLSSVRLERLHKTHACKKYIQQ